MQLEDHVRRFKTVWADQYDQYPSMRPLTHGRIIVRLGRKAVIKFDGELLPRLVVADVLMDEESVRCRL